MYFGKKPSNVGSGSGVIAFYTGEADDGNTSSRINHEVCGLIASGDVQNIKSSVTGQSSKSLKSMPMSIKSAEEQINILAAFMSSYEHYIQGKIVDPAIANDDYDQLDPDDLQEMYLKWQLAMISRRAKTFKSTRRKFVAGRPGFDKTKVKCYNCNGFGHLNGNVNDPRHIRVQTRQGQITSLKDPHHRTRIM